MKTSQEADTLGTSEILCRIRTLARRGMCTHTHRLPNPREPKRHKSCVVCVVCVVGPSGLCVGCEWGCVGKGQSGDGPIGPSERSDQLGPPARQQQQLQPVLASGQTLAPLASALRSAPVCRACAQHRTTPRFFRQSGRSRSCSPPTPRLDSNPDVDTMATIDIHELCQGILNGLLNGHTDLQEALSSGFGEYFDEEDGGGRELLEEIIQSKLDTAKEELKRHQAEQVRNGRQPCRQPCRDSVGGRWFLRRGMSGIERCACFVGCASCEAVARVHIASCED